MNKNIVSLIHDFIFPKVFSYNKIGRYGIIIALKSILAKDKCLYGACASGNVYCARKILEYGAVAKNHDINAAIRGNHLKIIKLFLSKKVRICYEKVLMNACKKSSSDIIEYILSMNIMINNREISMWICYDGNFVKQFMKQYDFDYNYGLIGACAGGHKEVIELIYSKSLWFELGLSAACCSGKREMAELMLSYGAGYCINCTDARHNRNVSQAANLNTIRHKYPALLRQDWLNEYEFD